jgi:O-antigen/teichoic acid export membrane protein
MLHKRSIKEKLLKGGAWVVTGKVIVALVSLAVNAVLARLLTPEDMGAYFLTFSLVSAAAVVAQLGLTQTIVRFVAESMGADQPGRARLAMRLSARVVGLGALIMAGVLAFGGGAWIADKLFHSEIISNVTGLAALWMVVLTFQQFIAEGFRGFHDIRLATIFGGMVTGLLSMLVFLGLWLTQGYSDLRQVMLLTVVAGCSSVVLSSLFLWKKLNALPFSSSDQINTRKIVGVSWPIWITNLAFFVMLQFDLWIMGFFRSQEEVAIYGAAARIVALVSMSLIIVNAIVPPIIAEMYAQKNLEKLEKILRVVATIAGVPSAIILAIFILSGDSILGVVYGDYFVVGGTILVILSVGQLINVWAGSCGVFLIMTQHQKTAMWITMISGAIGVLTSFSLVNIYGGAGVAAGVVVGLLIQNVGMVLYVFKNEGIKTYIDFRISVESIRELKRPGFTGDSVS